MMKLALLSALAGGTTAFDLSSRSIAARASALSSSSSSLGAAEMSKSLSFLVKPAALDGSMIGNVRFDPLGFPDGFDLKWLRKAEIKHGWVSMLATIGFVVLEFYNFLMFASLHVDDSNMAPPPPSAYRP